MYIHICLYTVLARVSRPSSKPPPPRLHERVGYIDIYIHSGITRCFRSSWKLTRTYVAHCGTIGVHNMNYMNYAGTCRGVGGAFVKVHEEVWAAHRPWNCLMRAQRNCSTRARLDNSTYRSTLDLPNSIPSNSPLQRA